jgi:hypothetical protein
VKSLFVVHEGKDGDPMDSNTSDDDDNERKEESEDDDDDLFVTMGKTKQKEGLQENKAKESYLEEEAETTDVGGDTKAGCPRFQWRAGQHISPPGGKSNRRPSVVKEESVGCFLLPLSSFLTFVPLKLFKFMVYFSNMYAASAIATTGIKQISGAWWPGNISIAKTMAFFGILIKMVLRTTPGQSYASAWKQPEWHPYTLCMT